MILSHLKSFFLFTVQLFFASTVWGQNVEIPKITSVNIKPINLKPIITWSMQQPEKIDGYIVKRLIYNFPGVVDYSYNTIAQIDDPNIFSFLDTTTNLGPAKPEERIETYRIAAYKTENGQILLSPMSEPFKTVFLQSTFDLCKKRNVLRWNHQTQNIETFSLHKSSNGSPFQIIVSTTDTVFYDFDIQTETHYTYRITQTIDGFLSQSGNDTLFTNTLKVPDFINSQCLQVKSDTFNLVFRCDTTAQITDFVLLKSQRIPENFDTLAVIPFLRSDEIHFSDFQISGENHYFYVLIARNYCKFETQRSDTLSNIVLNSEYRDKTNILTWNTITKSNDYQLSRQIPSEDFQIIASTSNTTYSDDISSFYAEQFASGNSSATFCYTISSKIDSNICKSISNTTCLKPEEIIFVPNAFNPNDTHEDNRTFKPKIAFAAEYRMSIYSRNGSLVFETNDPNQGWTGFDASGSPYPQATYIYYISYKNNNGKKIVKTSYITLLNEIK